MVAGGVAVRAHRQRAAAASKWERLAALQADAEVIACVDAPEHLALASAAGVAAGRGDPAPRRARHRHGPLRDRAGRAGGRAGQAGGGRARGPARGRHGLRGSHCSPTVAAHAQGRRGPRVGAVGSTRTADEMRAAGLPVDDRELRWIGQLHDHGDRAGCDRAPGGWRLPHGPLLRRGVPPRRSWASSTRCTSWPRSAAGPPRSARSSTAGFKTMSDRGEMKPIPLGVPDSHVVYLSAEHTNLHLGPDAPRPAHRRPGDVPAGVQRHDHVPPRRVRGAPQRRGGGGHPARGPRPAHLSAWTSS